MSFFILNIILIFYFIISLIYSKKFGKLLGIIDIPDTNRKVHALPTPLLGGILIFPAIIINFYQFFYGSDYFSLKNYLTINFLLIFFFLIGFLDDKYELNAKIKTILTIGVLLLCVPLDSSFLINEISSLDIKKEIYLNQSSLLFTVFCIFFLYNALNFSDGLNGISISVSIFWFSVLASSNSSIKPMVLIIIIYLFLIIIPNLSNKIFLGNSGTSFISILLSLLFIKTYNERLIYFDQMILIFFFPCMDATRIIFERFINNKSPLVGDKNHFHHLLLQFVNKKYVFIIYILLCIFPYSLSFFIKSYFSLVLSTLLYFILFFLLKRKLIKTSH